MRIAVLAEWYPSPADPVHGLWAHRQAVAARDAGADVRVLALRRPVPPLALARLRPDLHALRSWAAGARASLRPLSLDGIEVRAVPWLGPPRPVSYGSWGWWMAPPLRRALDRLYREWRFDVLHAHSLAPPGHAAAGWAKRHPPAFVVSAHGPDMFDVPQRSPLGRHAVLSALRAADLVLANSGWAKRRCEELAGGPLPITVVHLGADSGGGEDAGAGELGGDGAARNGALTLVTVAHLQARKRHDVVLRALARLEERRRPRYLVIGDGEQRGALERLAAELGVADCVRFLGQLPNEEAVATVAGCDVFVMPGVQEPFGVAFVEAMGAGLPAIGGRGEGGPEDIAAAGGGMLLVTPGDVEELAGELARLSADRDELRRLGAEARANVQAHFTWGRCGRRTVEAYADAISRRSGRR